VYRIKVTVDNRAGILKPGMPVDASWDCNERRSRSRFGDRPGEGREAYGATTGAGRLSLEVRRGEMFGLIGPTARARPPRFA
jgi:hypothetical protein